MKCLGGSYGFVQISVIGAAIELAEKEKAPDKILNHLDELKIYLENVFVASIHPPDSFVRSG